VASIELAELIRDLRSELSRARAEGAGEDLRFEVGPVQLELNVVVSREAAPGARVRFWVVEAGADVKLSSSTAQKINLTLTPQVTGGGRALVAGDAAATER
jgi:Trypsin-co-occurring domain 2